MYEVERINGCFIEEYGKVWYRNGERHREDGPAVEYTDYL
jgi:hypothetical protein